MAIHEEAALRGRARSTAAPHRGGGRATSLMLPLFPASPTTSRTTSSTASPPTRWRWRPEQANDLEPHQERPAGLARRPFLFRPTGVRVTQLRRRNVTNRPPVGVWDMLTPDALSH